MKCCCCLFTYLSIMTYTLDSRKIRYFGCTPFKNVHVSSHTLYIHTYIYTYITGHYNPSVRIIDLVSHTTYVVCANFIHKWQDLQFKVDFERQIFWETFRGNFILLSEFMPKICWEEIAEELLFVFCFDIWPGSNPGFSSNKSTYYLLYHGDFTYITYINGHNTRFVRITTKVLILLMLCMLILHRSGGSYNLMSIPNVKFLRNF